MTTILRPIFYVLLFSGLMMSCNEKPVGLAGLQEKVRTQIDSIDGTVAVAFYELAESGGNLVENIGDRTAVDNGLKSSTTRTPDSLLINVDKKFHAASTMKVPVMIELYKQAAQGRLDLNDSILLKNEFKSIVDGSLYSMDIGDDSDDIIYGRIGKKVALKDLMYSMITVSSNLATNVLIELVDAKKVTATMRELGAESIEVLRGVEDQKAYDMGWSNSTTARDLMLIMKAIAEGSAGNAEDCHAMVAILKDQEFNDIIPLYLPEDVEVAHKTGVITGVHHDAAIVYLPDGRSYILVLLSKDLSDFERGTEQLAGISKSVYEYVVDDRP